MPWRARSSGTSTTTRAATPTPSSGTPSRSPSIRTTSSVSTDLGVSYYYNNQPDLAIKQLEHSLQVDPKHTKTLLNLGVVRAFGKQDLKGATEIWRRLVEIAPDSPEGRQAKQALDSLSSAHGNAQ